MKGVLVVLSGADGAGKTSIATRSVEMLAETGIDTLYLYGRYQPRLLRPFIRLGSILQPSQSSQSKWTTLSREVINRARSAELLYFILCMCDYLVETGLMLKRALGTHDAVILDRYYLDSIVSDFGIGFVTEKGRLKRLGHVAAKLFPKPSLQFVVQVDAETAYRRKNDLPGHWYVNEWWDLFGALLEGPYTVLDGRRPVDDNAAMVADSVRALCGGP